MKEVLTEKLENLIKKFEADYKVKIKNVIINNENSKIVTNVIIGESYGKISVKNNPDVIRFSNTNFL